VEVVPAVLALLIVLTLLIAVVQMAAGELATAGLSFLAASILIFVRERRLQSKS
jgi:hypothetical protein